MLIALDSQEKLEKELEYINKHLAKTKWDLERKMMFSYILKLKKEENK